MSHTNSGNCFSCAQLFLKYPGFHQPLKDWFELLQSKHPEAHISCAGRGAEDQNALLFRGATKAHFGQSAHNWNAAIDLFQLKDGTYNLDKDWFEAVIVPALTSDLCWYGRPDAPYPERPHIEIASWNEMAKNGILKIVDSLDQIINHQS